MLGHAHDKHAQPLEEAPLLHKVMAQDRSTSRFGSQDGRRWRQPPPWNSPGARSATMRRDATNEGLDRDISHGSDGHSPPKRLALTGPDYQFCRDDPDELQGAFACGSAVDFRPGKELTSKLGDVPADLETVSTTTGQLSRATREAFECRGVPWQCQAKRYYPLLFPFCLLELFVFCGPVLVMYKQAAVMSSERLWRTVLTLIPQSLAIVCWLFALIGVVVTYIYHFLRLRGSEHPPDNALAACHEPLTHVVIVCSYKEPLEVLVRTFSSIAGQRSIRKPPIAVFAAEARDPSWKVTFETLKEVCSGRVSRLLSTEHVLAEGEAVGKSANENWAAREVHRLLVDEHGLDPFEVMLTIVDADSVLSSTYLAHLEAAFREQPDGRRLVYNGPLNVYRNFAEAGTLVQCLELLRCHQDTFHSLFQVPYPYSNYSLTLGFAAETGFWTPDVMPEDIHTVNKAMVNSFGSKTTVTIPSIICNDLVAGVADRYQQAKRHQYGSVTELAWIVALFQDMGLRFHAWWAIFISEASRAGSLIGTVACLAAFLTEMFFCVILVTEWQHVPGQARFLLSLAGSFVAWQWLWFWIAEFALWQTLLYQFPVERPPIWRWPLLVLLMPGLQSVNRVIFLILPTFHALYHAIFYGELAYVCAPKGNSVHIGHL